jgi:hypothetical protein
LWTSTASRAAEQGSASSPATTPAASANPTAQTGPSSADATKAAQAATDAVIKVESAVGNARDLISKADRYASGITDITGADQQRTSPTLDDLQTIQAIVAGI